MSDQMPLFTMPQSSLTTDDYYTPKWVFDALGVEFDLDVACPPGGSPHTPCKHYYTQADDGLTSPWFGTVWMNPPYSKPAPWVEKWLEHADGFALLPFAKSKWCESLWDDTRTRLVYLRAMKFERSDISLNNQAPFSLGLWAIGDKCVEALTRSGLGKVR